MWASQSLCSVCHKTALGPSSSRCFRTPSRRQWQTKRRCRIDKRFFEKSGQVVDRKISTIIRGVCRRTAVQGDTLTCSSPTPGMTSPAPPRPIFISSHNPPPRPSGPSCPTPWGNQCCHKKGRLGQQRPPYSFWPLTLLAFPISLQRISFELASFRHHCCKLPVCILTFPC